MCECKTKTGLWLQVSSKFTWTHTLCPHTARPTPLLTIADFFSGSARALTAQVES